ncbi:MAG: DUF3800 domain-containing protein [Thiomicrorhabdus chilensis]|uniref:DUF3800 domain-containing protein n=1 Tax=Thiomicrorhabdus chilensis TaxID=63656 RepID=UPI00299D832B|nr:DUF3800 domain-containing protein [Thiomicrorhabdus chilensis]MDX1346980.1 DUF3800 domain-containing protein [Thiomicrorhabdus chilensis]
MLQEFSDYIVYVDESGDHGLVNIDPNYPIFVLAFCIFHKRHYSDFVVSALQQFKFKHFGHDLVVLHEHEIRKEKGSFNLFKSKEQKYDFLNELTELIDSSNFILTCCVIDKEALLKRHSEPDNPYHIALALGLERIYQFLEEKGQHEMLTHIVFEERGKKEDAELELEFRRIGDGQNYYKKALPFDIKLANKQTNSAGLQLADLVARPVGLSVLRPEQPNRAFDVLKKKFFCEGGRGSCGVDFDGWGLKRFP